MAISIVNGYFCASSCDVSKAKKGENPHPSTDPGNVDADNKRNPLRPDAPVVLFGGSLRETRRADAVEAADGAQPADPAAARRTGQAVDVLA